MSALLEQRPWKIVWLLNEQLRSWGGKRSGVLHASRGRIPTCFRRLAWTSCLRGGRQPTTSVGAAVFWRCLPKWVSREHTELKHLLSQHTCLPLAPLCIQIWFLLVRSYASSPRSRPSPIDTIAGGTDTITAFSVISAFGASRHEFFLQVSVVFLTNAKRNICGKIFAEREREREREREIVILFDFAFLSASKWNVERCDVSERREMPLMAQSEAEGVRWSDGRTVTVYV